MSLHAIITSALAIGRPVQMAPNKNKYETDNTYSVINKMEQIETRQSNLREWQQSTQWVQTTIISYVSIGTCHWINIERSN